MKTLNVGTNTLGRTFLLVVGTVVVTLGVTFVTLFATGMLAPLSRQAEVAARGANVMPFDLDKTQHMFSQLPDGGLQKVVGRGSSDVQQITLIPLCANILLDRLRTGNPLRSRAVERPRQ